ncbi:XrtA/PEP-CTERM system histidine kinase PrsK [Sandarakinorhabdus sp.]|uniref:XrtA/PEP-CTERM system histidine kinase PrsK n=1 Tax=Sandarakinorhabdus sp. TaxID=1916663 RepID=UPI00286E17BB|nr:XrtA/PEP-CTERM system histidine kinase PrsK [Sandarakinorhabdus sp.]
MLLTDVGLASHFIAALGFAGLTVAAVWRQRLALNLWLAAAAAVTALWAATFVAAMLVDLSFAPWISRLQTVKVAAWIGLLLHLLRPVWQGQARGRASFVVGGVLGFVLTLQMVVDLLGATGGALNGGTDLAAQFFLVTRIAVSVTGLVLAHNLYIGSDVGTRNGLRLLAIALAGLFLYDLNFYTLAFLLPPASPDLYNIRGAVDTLVVPLLIFATRDSWLRGARVSRQVVFQSVAFSGVGFYLIAMSVLAYGLKLVGGDWGALLQVTFLSAMVIAGAVVLFSPRSRAWLRVQIAKNFFRYKYDYRHEWLRFIATVSQPGDAAGLTGRVVQAVCTVVDSPGGALLVPEDDAMHTLAQWQLGGSDILPLPLGSPLIRYLADGPRIIDLDGLRAGDAEYEGLECPGWLVADRRLWLLLPVIHIETLVGVLIIRQSLVPRPLNWEDFDLLKTLGRQAGSYIAESASQSALADAQRFEEFNRRFAFILHDIKNLVSQLSLVARNAERHADNPAFRADMVATLQSSVGKMNSLLGWLSQRAGTAGEGALRPVPLGLLLRQLVRSRAAGHAGLSLDLPKDQSADALVISGDAGRIEQLFAHLLQNAMDASAPDAPISLTVRTTASEVIVTLADRGHGMSARFIRQELFQPFRSTKPDGFGIGAYEAREIARSHGGRLEVASQEGEGTTFTVILPLLAPEMSGIAAQ